MTHNQPETLVERRVTYTLEVQGKLIVVENVPARVCPQTGEQFFSPETVEKLQQMAWGKRQPQRTVQTPVYDFFNDSVAIP